MVAAYFDLKKAFDLVYREALWDLLRRHGILARIIGLLIIWSVLWDCECCEAWRWRVLLLSCEHESVTGIHACSTTFKYLHGLRMEQNCGQSVGNTDITDLVFADDSVIFTESMELL